jgi:hypothetical protein
LGVPLRPAYRIYLPEVEVGLPAAGRVGLEFIPIFIGALVLPKYGATPLLSLTHRSTTGIAFSVSN